MLQVFVFRTHPRRLSARCGNGNKQGIVFKTPLRAEPFPNSKVLARFRHYDGWKRYATVIEATKSCPNSCMAFFLRIVFSNERTPFRDLLHATALIKERMAQ
jgi:hypothetical protein